MINGARASSGLDGLRLSSAMSKRAHRHSARMAESGRLFHSCLTCSRASGSTSAIAENVGVGDSLKKVHTALMKSSTHRANILSKDYERVGVGIVRRSGRVWVTELFSG
ncbi:MAG: CAP domain-containing protein [Actinomycetota bacterium]